MNLKQLVELLKSAGAKWNEHNAPRLGAALAYYSLLSIAPLLILVVAIFGLVFSKQAAEQQLLNQVSSLAGYSTAQTVQSLINGAHRAASGIVATIIALVTLLFGASGVFVELRSSLNTIWDAKPPANSGWRSMINQRLASFGMVLALGFLLLVSLLASTAITIVEKFFSQFVPMHWTVLGTVINSLVSLISISVLFALIFKFVPDVPIRWREVGIGAVVTAILFTIGKALLGFYLGTAGVGSTYGAAGSLVALVVWVYYSAQIFFFGAVFTRVYADSFGTKSAKRDRAVARASTATA